MYHGISTSTVTVFVTIDCFISVCDSSLEVYVLKVRHDTQIKLLYKLVHQVPYRQIKIGYCKLCFVLNASTYTRNIYRLITPIALKIVFLENTYTVIVQYPGIFVYGMS